MGAAGPNRVTRLYYSVFADFARAARPQRTLVEKLSDAFHAIYANLQVAAGNAATIMVGGAPKPVASATDTELRTAYQNAVGYPAPAVPTEDLRQLFVQGTIKHSGVYGPVAAWPSGAQLTFDTAIASEPGLDELLRAVATDIGGAYKLLPMSELGQRMRANAALWAYEDAAVPSQLLLTLEYDQGAITGLGFKNRAVPIDLPDQYTAPWHPDRAGMLPD